MGKLTNTFCTNTKVAKMYPDGDGLYLKVQGSAKDPGRVTKSWMFRWGAGGKNTMGLGSYPEVTLARARELTLEKRRMITEGIDPREERQQRQLEIKRQQNTKTFKDHALDYIDAQKAGWKNPKHVQQWGNTLETYAYPVIGDLTIDQITLDHVRQILDPIWTTKNETAERLRGRMERVIDAAMIIEDRPVVNHAKLKGRLEHVLPASQKAKRVQHHAALKYTALKPFYDLLKAHGGIAAMCMRFTILTACRTNESIGATWAEIDLDNRVWTIPKTRMKKGKEHRVPLSDEAVTLLKELKGFDLSKQWVFPSPMKPQQHLSNMGMLSLLKKGLKRADITVHGFRSTFRDWAGETTSHEREVIEHALAHQLADETEAAYQRGDYFEKRKVLMQDWSTFATGQNLAAMT